MVLFSEKYLNSSLGGVRFREHIWEDAISWEIGLGLGLRG